MPKSAACIRAAIDTTSRFVDVPIVVAMPPIRTAKFIGISRRRDESPVSRASATSTGISSTTIGVSLMKPLTSIEATRTTPSPAFAPRLRHSSASLRVTGRSAPVSTSARPSTIRLQMAISASCEKPWKKASGSTRPSAPS